MFELTKLKKFVEEMEIPSHCVYCEGVDISIKNPKHHPSYEITHRCNLKCVFCYSEAAVKAGTAPKPGYYGEDDPKAITISQYGEPLVVGADKVAYVIRELKKRFGDDVRIDLQTNGTLLDKNAFSKLENLVDIVMISLDASNPEGYMKLTGANAFERVCEALKIAARSDVVSVLRTIYMPGINDKELVDIAKIGDQAGVDEMMLQPCSVYDEESLKKLGFDFEKAESMAEFLKAAYKCQEAVDSMKVKIPGCMLVNLRHLLESGFDFEDIMFLRRDSRARNPPTIRRDWKFEILL